MSCKFEVSTFKSVSSTFNLTSSTFNLTSSTFSLTSSTFNLTSSTFNFLSSTLNTKSFSLFMAAETSSCIEPPFKDCELKFLNVASPGSPPPDNSTNPPFAKLLGNKISPCCANTLPVLPIIPPLCIIGGEL